MILIGLLIPQIMRSRVIGNETAAVGNLKALNNACQLYGIERKVFPDNLSDLANSTPPYMDSALASGTKQGYQFIYTLVDQDHFTIQANSMNSGLLRGRYFYSDESGLIRYNNDNAAGPDDPIFK